MANNVPSGNSSFTNTERMIGREVIKPLNNVPLQPNNTNMKIANAGEACSTLEPYDSLGLM